MIRAASAIVGDSPAVTTSRPRRSTFDARRKHAVASVMSHSADSTVPPRARATRCSGVAVAVGHDQPAPAGQPRCHRRAHPRTGADDHVDLGAVAELVAHVHLPTRRASVVGR